MTQQRTEFTVAETSELERLAEEFSVASGSLRKRLRVDNPPTIGQVSLFFEAEEQLVAVLTRIKEILEEPG